MSSSRTEGLFLYTVPRNQKEKNLVADGLRIIDGHYDGEVYHTNDKDFEDFICGRRDGFNITQSLKEELMEYMGYLYNGGIKITEEVFSALIQTSDDLEEVLAQFYYSENPDTNPYY